MSREDIRLPGKYENRYKSSTLKEKIADISMWGLIPSVTYTMDSPAGIKRIKENDLLFSFIDDYFGDLPIEFEPNMRDGRFVFLPENVNHQGIGICVSSELPGFLEIGHFWYPEEFTEKDISAGFVQVYIPMFSMKPGAELARMVQSVYYDETVELGNRCCTFPFDLDITVSLRGCFLDNMNQSVNTIRNALKDKSPQMRRNGEGLIHFMQNIMK